MIKLGMFTSAVALLLSSHCLGQVISSNPDGGSLVPGPGDLDGSATAGAWLIDEEIHFDIEVEAVTLPLTGAHIHQGAAGINGAAVLDLSAFIDGSSVRGTAAIAPALAADILADPAGYYLVIRNDDFPAGALRDQFELQPTTLLGAELRAENEVPPLPPGPNGTAQLLVGQFTISYDMTAEGIEMPPTGHHVHEGAAGVNGPVLVAFDPLAWSGDINAASARGIVLAEPAIIQDILADPAGHYINVHTDTFPAGAIRGQLFMGQTAGSIGVAVNATWVLLLMTLALALTGLAAARARI
jgi:hypothetical protein